MCDSGVDFLELLEIEREVGGAARGLGHRTQLIDAALDGTAGIAVLGALVHELQADRVDQHIRLTGILHNVLVGEAALRVEAIGKDDKCPACRWLGLALRSDCAKASNSAVPPSGSAASMAGSSAVGSLLKSE